MSETERESAAAPAAATPGTSASRRTLPVAASGWCWLPLTVAVIVADRAVKLWITHHFAPFERVHVDEIDHPAKGQPVDHVAEGTSDDQREPAG